MTTTTETAKKGSGLRIPGFAQLQRLGKSLMLPIALLPAAGILLRLGQDDLLGQINTPVVGPFFDAPGFIAGLHRTDDHSNALGFAAHRRHGRHHGKRLHAVDKPGRSAVCESRAHDIR